MRTVDQLVQEIERLPAASRRNLLRRLTSRSASSRQPGKTKRARGKASYGEFLNLVGTVTSAEVDVSENKYQYLADAYAATASRR